MNQGGVNLLELHRQRITALTQDVNYLRTEVKFLYKQIGLIKAWIGPKDNAVKEIDDKTLEERN